MKAIAILFIFLISFNSVYTDSTDNVTVTTSTDDNNHTTNTEEINTYSTITNDYTDELGTSDSTSAQDLTTITTSVTPTKQTPTTTIEIFYRPSIKLNLDLGCSDMNCTLSFCKNETALFSLENTLNLFLCEKFSPDLLCELKIENTKTCNLTLHTMIFYELKMKPRNSKDLEEIKDNLHSYIHDLESDEGEKWNTEFSYILTAAGIDIEFNFSTSINSFNKSYEILNSSSECLILTCNNQYFSPICSQSSNFICKHQCETTNYCMNNGECLQSITYEPICKCSYANVHNWGLSMHYKGEKCEIRDRTISRSLFILIVTLISSLFVLVVILAALKFHIFKKKTGDKGVTMIYA